MIFAAVALLGCENEHPGGPLHKQDNAIAFGQVATRADLSDIQNGGFGVWATFSNSEQTNYPLMENTHVTYESGAWEYDDTKYWIDNTVFNFVAAYPYDEAGNIFTFANNAVSLSVSETPSTEDYLLATATVDTSAEGFDPGNAVELKFGHLLTNVNLQIWRDGGKHQNDDMRIKKVTLSNIRKGGTYSSSTNTWAPTGEKLTLEYVNDNLSDDDNIGAAIVNENGSLIPGGTSSNPFGEMLLLPQTIGSSNNVSLKIEYELKRQNAADWETAELETKLPNITWNVGTKYTYNVVLSSVTDITVYYIQTKVDPWGTPQVGGTVIIK